MIRSLYIAILLLFSELLLAQYRKHDDFAIQFSGVVVTEHETSGEMIPLPYTNVAIKGTSRGTISALDGFFSIVALKGDTIVFSYLGFKTVEFVLPDTLNKHFYSYFQIMSKTEYLLPTAVIHPWPSKQHFKQEFLAMDVSDELLERAKENLAEEVLHKMIAEVPGDPRESYNMLLRQQANAAYHAGQFQPMKIFDLIAWQKFIQAWKRGDFKKKKE